MRRMDRRVLACNHGHTPSPQPFAAAVCRLRGWHHGPGNGASKAESEDGSPTMVLPIRVMHHGVPRVPHGIPRSHGLERMPRRPH